MSTYISLSHERCIGLDGEFNEQLKVVESLDDWNLYKDNQQLFKKNTDEAALNEHGRRFCHLKEIAVFIGATVLISRMPKHKGYVVRYPFIETVFEALLSQHDLKAAWDDYFMVSTFALLDSDGSREPDNWGIYWHDLKRFLAEHNITLEALL